MTAGSKTATRTVSCRVCHGTGMSKHTGSKCGCCGGSGKLTAEEDRARKAAVEDLRRRVLGQDWGGEA